MLIDLSKNIYCERLYAKRLWEALFREVKAEQFKSLYDFLCDLRIFETMMRENKKEIYWEYDPKYGCTNVTDYNPNNSNCYRIKFQLDDRKIIVEKV